MGWSDFQYRENTHTERKPGTYRCIILSAEQSISKSSGNNMLVIRLRPSGTAATVNAYIVDNQYFDSNVSEFLDAFPQLKEHFSINACVSWRGALGAVRMVVDDGGYLKAAKYPWVSAAKAEALPPFEWKARSDESEEMPVYSGFMELGTTDDDLDIPF